MEQKMEKFDLYAMPVGRVHSGLNVPAVYSDLK